jgi:exosortase C (VPDSG-CTERM-specific)
MFMPDTAAPSGLATAQTKKFALAAALLALAFAVPLWRLLRFAGADDLHSYIPLMPLISGYLVWTQKSKLPRRSVPARTLAALFFAAGSAATAGYFSVARFATPATLGNSLALAMLALLLFLAGAGCWFLGGATMLALAFPFCLLGFMLPLPVFLRDEIEAALQHGSAVAADWMFTLAGTAMLRDGMLFRLPGINLKVAPECSGIHSSLVLFITSLLAGQMMLRQPWRRAVLCLAVIPLALIRNGFRVFVIGELCVHVGPKMIDSPIHHHGGPVFFVLSLAPFFLLLYFLKRTEPTGAAGPPPNSEKPTL